MRRDPRAYLWDALQAVRSVQDFTRDLIVGFRNILGHGYAEIDHARVWGVVEHDLGPLASILRGLQDERG